MGFMMVIGIFPFMLFLMALFGWTTAKQAALYTKKINRAKLEKQAAMLLQTEGHIEPAANGIRTNTPTFSR